MQFFDSFLHMFIRFRYPVSLPQDIAHALGISLKNTIAFEHLLMVCQSCVPTRLAKFMPRMEAERVFQSAQRKDRFAQTSLYSYFFSEGWLEFELHFDDCSRLRRIYIHHKLIVNPNGFELPLVVDAQAMQQSTHDTHTSLFIA